MLYHSLIFCGIHYLFMLGVTPFMMFIHMMLTHVLLCTCSSQCVHICEWCTWKVLSNGILGSDICGLGEWHLLCASYWSLVTSFQGVSPGSSLLQEWPQFSKIQLFHKVYVQIPSMRELFQRCCPWLEGVSILIQRLSQFNSGYSQKD